MQKTLNLLIINGSLGGPHGNCSKILENIDQTTQSLSQSQNLQIQTQVLHLAEGLDHKKIEKSLLWANAFIFLSGTYWDSWGSPLQAFLEMSTEWEGQKHFFAKPAAVMITMHSVGGKEVMSRLQGVLSTFGVIIPPMSGMAYSLATHVAITAHPNQADDFWSLKDIDIIIHNLIITANIENLNQLYKSWPVDREHVTDTWL